ncbi:MAG: PEP-CTERM sorting domain-containing protein [Pirellulales bacterium]
MNRRLVRLAASVCVLVAGGGSSFPAYAAVSNLAAEFSLAQNPNGVWTYGYLNAGGFTHTNDDFILNGSNTGFVAYDQVLGAGGGGGSGWSTGFGFPFAGVWNVPPTAASVAPFPSLTDFPSAEGDNPDYPNGVIGGHAPNCNFCSGWHAIRYTAATSGPVDIDMVSWQTGIYPNTGPGGADPLFGGNTRPHQVMIQKQVGATTTTLIRTPQVTRHGWRNLTGTPEHTTAGAATPGDAYSFASQQDEIDAAIRSSANPNLYRLTNVQLNAGESLIISLAAYFGDNQVGFNGLNAVVRSGVDRIATSRWDLSDDWSVHGSTAAGIGPDGAWSYGILKIGAFAAYDKTMFGRLPDDGTLPRENHAWGTNAPGWFVASAAEPETGPVVPGMVKDYSGFNSLTKVFDSGTVSQVIGDWSGGEVALHTPSTEVDADRTSVIRWTAPRNMTVNADGALWRLTLPDDTDRRHQFELLKNGASLASGTIDELDFDCAGGGMNSACPAEFNVGGISVLTGDLLELHISPLAGSLVGDYNGDGTVNAPDYTVWRDSHGSQTQYDDWKANFGSTGGGGGNATPSFIGVDFTVSEDSIGNGGAVPEPASLMLFVAAAVFSAAALRRRIG